MKITLRTPWLLTFLFPLLLTSCKDNKDIDSSTMHVYKAEELQKIIDNAVKIEPIGEPTVIKTEDDSTIVISRTQIYKVYVYLGDDNRIIENPDTTSITLARPATGPIIITTSCNMTCTPVRPGESCNISGCLETKRCGCSQGSCGNNCTTDTACHQARSGFGFDRVIIF